MNNYVILFKKLIKMAGIVLTLLIVLASCQGRTRYTSSVQVSTRSNTTQPCDCPGGQPGALLRDDNQVEHCACILQQLPLSEGLGEYKILDDQAQAFSSFALAEPVDSLRFFLPRQQALLATRHDRDCGESLSLYSLRDGRVLRRLSPEGQCLQDMCSSDDGQRLFLLHKDNRSGELFASLFLFDGAQLRQQAMPVLLPQGMLHAHMARPIDERSLLLPMLINDDGAATATSLHSFVRVDFSDADAQARELFRLDAGQWLQSMQLNQGAVVVETTDSEDPDAAPLLQAFDLDSGALLGTVSGMLLSQQGALVILRDLQGQVRTWQPERQGEPGNPVANGGYTALLTQQAFAVTGLGPSRLQSGVFSIDTGEQILLFDGANQIDAGEELRSELLLLHAQGLGLLQHLYICQTGSCGGGPLVISKPGQRDRLLYAEPIRNSRTLLLGPLDDDGAAYALYALNPQDFTIEQLAEFPSPVISAPFFAPGLVQ